MSEKEIDIYPVIMKFVELITNQLTTRRKENRINFNELEVYEVTGALISRQVSLARIVAENPGNWNNHVAPLILRSMADVFISLAWINKDKLDRAQKFIIYGLGQEKLQLEHRKSLFEEREPTEDEVLLIEASEHWINSQRYTFLTDVNVGSWSGITTRAMAEEAGCIDFYNLVYTPFSACTHSTWRHVGKFNVDYCQNPLHKNHKIQTDPIFNPDVHYLYLAGKYIDKTFLEYDEAFDLKIEEESGFAYLSTDLLRYAPNKL